MVERKMERRVTFHDMCKLYEIPILTSITSLTGAQSHRFIYLLVCGAFDSPTYMVFYRKCLLTPDLENENSTLFRLWFFSTFGFHLLPPIVSQVQKIYISFIYSFLLTSQLVCFIYSIEADNLPKRSQPVAVRQTSK